MIHSMTGYAVASADSPRGALNLELRSVNSRFLDLQFRVAEELRAAEPLLRELIGGRITRGKVDCRLSFGNAASPVPSRLNVQAIQQLRELAAEAAKAYPGAAPLRLLELHARRFGEQLGRPRHRPSVSQWQRSRHVTRAFSARRTGARGAPARR